jgi:hypothetical protein
MAPIAELSGLDYPNVALILTPFFVVFELGVVVEEDLILWVFDALDDVEGEGEGLEDVHLAAVVEGSHVVEQRLLVADVVVLMEVVVHTQPPVVIDALDSLAADQPASFEVGALIDHDLVLGVAEEMPPPIVNVQPVEDPRVKLVRLCLQLAVGQRNSPFVQVAGVLLLSEDGVDLQLRPHEVAPLGLVGQRPPEPALDERLDHEGVVAAPHVGLVDHFFRLRPHEQAAGIVELPQEVQVGQHSLPRLFLRALLLPQAAHERLLLAEKKPIHYVVLRQPGGGSCVQTVNTFPALFLKEFPLWVMLVGVGVGVRVGVIERFTVLELALGLRKCYLMLL